MIEFDDLTPISLGETVLFYDFGWFDKYLIKCKVNFFGYRLNSEYVKIVTDLKCEGEVIAQIGPWEKLGCTMRRDHKGPCIASHPDKGIISQLPITTGFVASVQI